jgi:uncharacterized membrane protein YdjX (TVP38/TMEM64 family)
MDGSEKWNSKWKWLVWLLIVLCLYRWNLFYLFKNCDQFQKAILLKGKWSPLLLTGVATFSLVLLLPRTLILILAGLCFGVGWGTVLALVASMLSATIAFKVGRFLGRGWVEKKFKKMKWYWKLQDRNQTSGFLLVLVTRAVHLFHFGVTSYVCGALGVSWSAFLWGTFLGILPGTWVVVFTAETLGCSLWAGKMVLTSKLISWLVIATFLTIVPVILGIYITRKKTEEPF